jgi:thiamine transport system permease protein
MAGRAEPVSPKLGIGVAICVVALILACLGSVFYRAQVGSGLSAYDWAAVRFTLIQAVLSAVFSVALAIPVARALARRQFVGRQALVILLGAPFILPVIVAVLGLLQVFGRAGWFSLALGWVGLPPIQIYGLHGVVLAHVFFNLPLATRLILQGWQDIPAERFRLAAQLGAGPLAMWRLLEKPMLMRLVPGVLAVVFAICLTSFAVALTLGGGPKATTIELAIYQAFRFDFDLSRAAMLSVVQIVLTGAAAIFAFKVSRGDGLAGGLDRPVQRWDTQTISSRGLDTAIIAGASLFLILPLAAIVLSGLPKVFILSNVVYSSAITSIVVSLGSTCVLLAVAIPMALAAATHRYSWIEMVGLLGLATSPLVMGTGLFLLINPLLDPSFLALPVTVLVNAILALPFALRILVPGARTEVARFGRLGLALNMQDWQFLRRVILPRIRPQIGFAAGLTAALSMGDLGVIVLFADPERATLPLQIFRLMGSFQMQDAAGAALLLLVLSLAIFWLLDRGWRYYAKD